MKLTKTEVTQQVRRDIEQANQQVRAFQQLSEDALRYRPHPDRWNVLDCLEHIHLFYVDYVSRMEPTIYQASAPSQPTPMYTPGFFAQKMIDGLRPQAGQRKRKIKTFKKMIPDTDHQRPDQIVDAFFHDHTQLELLLEQSEALDWNRLKVTSALGFVLRFKLGDCFRVLMAHTERHLLQCQEVLSACRGNTVGRAASE